MKMGTRKMSNTGKVRTAALGVLVPAVLAGSTLAAGLALRAQDDPAERGEARPVPLRERAHGGQRGEDPAAPDRGGSAFDGSDFARRLTDPDLDRRLTAFEELLGSARADGDARAALHAWAEDPQRGELAWTARLALRELERRPASPWAPRWRGFAPFEDGFAAPFQDSFEELFGDFFGGQGLRDLDTHFREPLARLEERMRELEGQLERQLGRGFGRAPGARGAPAPPPTPPTPLAPLPGAPGTTTSTARSLSVQIGPEGASVRITETRDGEEHTQEYRADSLEELLQQHPELERELGGQLPGLRAPRGRPAPDPWQDLPGISPGPRLGIQFEPLGEERALELGLEPGEGLVVIAVIPGSLAERLGLERGDVLLELEGRRLRGAGDVRGALQRAGPGPVRARVIGPDGRARDLEAAAAAPRRLRPVEGLDTERF